MAKDRQEKVLESLKMAEQEEGRSGLVAEYLAKNPEIKPKGEKK